jgi:betaine lipid synthase
MIVTFSMDLITNAVFGFASDPIYRVGIACAVLVLFLAVIFAAAFTSPSKSNPFVDLGVYARFVYACFLKPHTGDDSGSQQDALESFYKAQAVGYDATRARLLHGRDDLLGLVASQLKEEKTFATGKPIWVDVSFGQESWNCTSNFPSWTYIDLRIADRWRHWLEH